jgi:hypothetical protein
MVAIAWCVVGRCAGSITTVLPVTEIAAFLGGFVAAEGCFTRTGRRFRFAIALGAKDAKMCDVAAVVLGVGHVARSPRRQPHFDDEVIFAVQSTKQLVDRVVPFMDRYLPPSKKRNQYEKWRFELLHFWESGAKRLRTCTVSGCERPQRAKGVCRHHYYERYRG